MENDGRRIPNRLKKHRMIHGYRQKDVAFLLGHTSTNMICKWERGHAVPSFRNLLKLSAIYSVLPLDLYFDVFKEQRDTIAHKRQALLVQATEQ